MDKQLIRVAINALETAEYFEDSPEMQQLCEEAAIIAINTLERNAALNKESGIGGFIEKGIEKAPKLWEGLKGLLKEAPERALGELAPKVTEDVAKAAEGLGRIHPRVFKTNREIQKALDSGIRLKRMPTGEIVENVAKEGEAATKGLQFSPKRNILDRLMGRNKPALLDRELSTLMSPQTVDPLVGSLKKVFNIGGGQQDAIRRIVNSLGTNPAPELLAKAQDDIFEILRTQAPWFERMTGKVFNRRNVIAYLAANGIGWGAPLAGTYLAGKQTDRETAGKIGAIGGGIGYAGQHLPQIVTNPSEYAKGIAGAAAVGAAGGAILNKGTRDKVETFLTGLLDDERLNLSPEDKAQYSELIQESAPLILNLLSTAVQKGITAPEESATEGSAPDLSKLLSPTGSSHNNRIVRVSGVDFEFKKLNECDASDWILVENKYGEFGVLPKSVYAKMV